MIIIMTIICALRVVHPIETLGHSAALQPPIGSSGQVAIVGSRVVGYMAQEIKVQFFTV